MERLPIESTEMELRHNWDFIEKLKMIGEGGPVFEKYDEDESAKIKLKTPEGFDEEELPRDYQ